MARDFAGANSEVVSDAGGSVRVIIPAAPYKVRANGGVSIPCRKVRIYSPQKRTPPASLVLGGDGDYVSTCYAGIGGNASRAICAWVKWTHGDDATILAYGGSDTLHFRLIFVQSLKTLFVANDAGNLASISTFDDATWAFVAVTFDTSDDTLYIYKNAGAPDVSGVRALNTGTVNVRIGLTTTDTAAFKGNMSDVMFFNAYLTQADIQAIYDLGRNPTAAQVAGLGSYSDLVSWWPFVADANDAKSSNHGTLEANAYVVSSTSANIRLQIGTDATSTTGIPVPEDRRIADKGRSPRLEIPINDVNKLYFVGKTEGDIVDILWFN